VIAFLVDSVIQVLTFGDKATLRRNTGEKAWQPLCGSCRHHHLVKRWADYGHLDKQDSFA